MAANPNAPLFANRYRFESVSYDWDRGRSGYTHLVYDLKENRLGVIKRAEINSRQSTEGLKSEIRALKALKGLGVPEVYDIGQAVYGSKNYDYMVIEYIDGIRVEKNLSLLNVIERAEIITKLFALLSQAHQKGIVNGDVDLKHLFWGREKKQLTVIDWGNAKLGVPPKKNTEYAYDLARAAEIVFSLVTRQGEPSGIGSIALPDNSALIPGLGSLPVEFRNLCKWAPRTPSDGVQAPYTALVLYKVSKKWFAAINSSIPYQSTHRTSRWGWLIWFLLLSIIAGVFFSAKFLLPIFQAVSIASSATTIVSSETSSIVPSDTSPAIETIAPITETAIPSDIPTETASFTQAVISSPGTYSVIMAFDQALQSDKFLTADKKNCWVNQLISPSNSRLLPIPKDGFYRRTDENWSFNVGLDHSTQDIIQVDFSDCLDTQNIEAFALNVAIQRLDIPEYEPASEFGFFLENQNGRRREYTLWLDKSEAMYLRIREDDNNPEDYPVLVVSSTNLHFGGEYPRPYSRFPLQIFFEVDNNGSDIIYLLEGPYQSPVLAEAINPSQMIPIDIAKLPTLGDVQKIGLLGRGGKTETLIWPLAFLEGELK
ncbi:MAG: hypothetical protein JNK26_05220 [Candidatus Doudnabacteria bacterium]|nr:hypothetical protein [Candidatus Doudnabacteria bacterium]